MVTAETALVNISGTNYQNLMIFVCIWGVFKGAEFKNKGYKPIGNMG